MILTEEEAKTKICCGGEGCGVIIMIKTGLVEDNYERRCLGSACMAWRWAPTPDLTADRSTSHGFCGKAGRP